MYRILCLLDGNYLYASQERSGLFTYHEVCTNPDGKNKFYIKEFYSRSEALSRLSDTLWFVFSGEDSDKDRRPADKNYWIESGYFEIVEVK